MRKRLLVSLLALILLLTVGAAAVGLAASSDALEIAGIDISKNPVSVGDYTKITTSLNAVLYKGGADNVRVTLEAPKQFALASMPDAFNSVTKVSDGKYVQALGNIKAGFDAESSITLLFVGEVATPPATGSSNIWLIVGVALIACAALAILFARRFGVRSAERLLMLLIAATLVFSCVAVPVSAEGSNVNKLSQQRVIKDADGNSYTITITVTWDDPVEEPEPQEDPEVTESAPVDTGTVD